MLDFAGFCGRCFVYWKCRSLPSDASADAACLLLLRFSELTRLSMGFPLLLASMSQQQGEQNTPLLLLLMTLYWFSRSGLNDISLFAIFLILILRVAHGSVFTVSNQ